MFLLVTGAPMCWDRLRSGQLGWDMHVLDTSELTAEQVADRILGWCRQALAGRAPVIQLP